MADLERAKEASRAAQAGLAALYSRPAQQLPLQLVEPPDAAKYRPDFRDWLAANEAIWLRFVAEANKVWDRGRRHYSARTIVEVMRHETALAEVGSAWKLNNNFAPDLARRYQELYPERAELFATRVQQGGARAA